MVALNWQIMLFDCVILVVKRVACFSDSFASVIDVLCSDEIFFFFPGE